MRHHFPSAALLLAITVCGFGGRVAAQSPGGVTDLTRRLQSALPAEAASRVIAAMSRARAAHLPADAIANRSLKFVARGVPPADIAAAADEQVGRMQTARAALAAAHRSAAPDEIEAGAEAIREGVDGALLTQLAQSAPPGRTLTVSLYAIGTLVHGGMAPERALATLQQLLQRRASDAEIEQKVGPGQSGSAGTSTDPGRGAVLRTPPDLAAAGTHAG